MLLGEVLFFVVIVLVVWPQQRGQSPIQLGSNPHLLLYCASTMLVVTAPLAFVLRMLIFRSRDQQGHISPAAFFSGTIVFLALLEGAAFFGLVNLMLSREMWPHVLVP